ncbi:hypothetical protein EDD18DRAFT_1342939 [Armillaria luteobubalina]|uniref:Uncharacterized protein n=1 Tax=Armillaria luteobubalina TaxID=153913 RepID=A0AA39UWT8_9AGAR|nr:hypothetical protein EDD18DRAFT_1342939 [Armillaria luteobubalina]
MSVLSHLDPKLGTVHSSAVYLHFTADTSILSFLASPFLDEGMIAFPPDVEIITASTSVARSFTDSSCGLRADYQKHASPCDRFSEPVPCTPSDHQFAIPIPFHASYTPFSRAP